MVDIPSIRPQVASGPSVAIPTVGSTAPAANFRRVPTVRPVGLEASARAFGQSIQAIGAMGDAVGAAGDTVIKELERTQRIEAERLYSEGILGAETAIQAAKRNVDPETNDFPQSALVAYDEYVATQLEQKGLSSFQREILSQRYAANRTNVGVGALKYQARLELGMANLDSERITEANINRILQDPDAYGAVTSDTSDALNAIPDPLQRAQTARILDESYAAAYVSSLIDHGDLNAAAVAMEDDSFNGLLDPKQKQALSKDLSRANTRETAAAESLEQETRAETYANERVAVGRGESSHSKLDSLREAEQITDSQWATLTLDLDKQAVIEAESVTKGLLVSSAINGETILIPGNKQHQDAVDEYFVEKIMPAVTGDVAGARTSIVNFVASTGIMPEGLEGRLRAEVRNGSPEQRAEAADIFMRIQEANPAIRTGLDAADTASLERIAEITRVRPDPEEAIRQFEQEQANPNVAMVRTETFDSDFDFADAQSRAIDEFDSFFEFEPGVTTVAGASIRLQNDMRSLAQQYFVQNPDMGMSMDYAAKEIKRTWGVTSVAGSGKRMMKYAPESILPSIEGHSWVQEQLMKDVASIDPAIEADSVFIFGDPETARSVTKDGGAISYPIMIQAKDGTLDLLRNDDGEPLRYVTDYNAALKKFEASELKTGKRRRATLDELQERAKEASSVRPRSLREGF